MEHLARNLYLQNLIDIIDIVDRLSKIYVQTAETTKLRLKSPQVFENHSTIALRHYFRKYLCQNLVVELNGMYMLGLEDDFIRASTRSPSFLLETI